MKAFKPKKSKGPEKTIQDKLEDFLRMKGWFVLRTHGNMYQSGFPDIFVTHSRYGHRWIEVKLPNMEGSRFTGAQLETFPKLSANGSGVWILTGATDSEYEKLFKRCNWYQYLDVMHHTRGVNL